MQMRRDSGCGSAVESRLQAPLSILTFSHAHTAATTVISAMKLLRMALRRASSTPDEHLPPPAPPRGEPEALGHPSGLAR